VVEGPVCIFVFIMVLAAGGVNVVDGLLEDEVILDALGLNPEDIF
jgi:hypothetical protein